MLFLMFCVCFKDCFIRYCFHRCGFVFKVGSINSLCQIFDLSLSAECQFLRERCGHRD